MEILQFKMIKLKNAVNAQRCLSFNCNSDIFTLKNNFIGLSESNSFLHVSEVDKENLKIQRKMLQFKNAQSFNKIINANTHIAKYHNSNYTKVQ